MICVFGNEHLSFDSFALDVSKELGVEVRHCTSPEQLLDVEGDIIILDVVKDAVVPLLLRPDQIKTRTIMSMHDFDVGFFLKLMKEMGIEKNIKIIGIPSQGDSAKIAQQVKVWI